MLDQGDELVARRDAVSTGEPMRRLGVAGPHRLADQPMRLCRADRPGPQPQGQHAGAMGLVRHRLGNAAQAAIAAALDQQAVEQLVGLGPAGEILRRQCLLHRRRRGLELVGHRRAILVRQRRQQLRRHRLDRDDDLVDLADVLRGQRADQHAALRQHPHQPVLLQADDRLVHRGPAHAETDRDLLLRALIARGEDGVADRLLQRGIGLVDQRAAPGPAARNFRPRKLGHGHLQHRPSMADRLHGSKNGSLTRRP